MIAFASLFLGLMLGVRPVEVVVGDGVAAVELRLDGRRLGKLTGAPWVMECDFGPELAPRHLEAVAFDAGERELGRVSQWINLPQERAVTSLVLEPRRPGEPRIARLSWESVAGAEPESVVGSLDGQPLAIDDPRRIVLPAVDETEFHLLQVEMRFEGRVSTRVDLTFGGAYADQVSTELTALPIAAVSKAARPPTAAAAQGWFLKDGEVLRVIAVEKGTAEVVVVLGRPFPRFFLPGEGVKTPKSLDLARDQRARFVFTVPEQSKGVATTFDLFPTSRAYDRGDGDLYRLLTGFVRPPENQPPRLNAAVAVAGLAAYQGRHRRAVVLVPAAEPEGVEDLAPVQVRRYLERLRVPFVVWDPEAGSRGLEGWGSAADRRAVGSVKQLAAAWTELAAELDRQWIVWLDGRHLPQDVTLSPEAAGFVLPR